MKPLSTRPNVILVMCDDLGYGDTGFNGNETIKTPSLDRLAQEGARFTRFYAGGPVCSPTRGTCLTGRHYYRYGITTANEGTLPKQEMTLQRLFKQQGYRTGHFGKWHLGTLTKEMKDGRRGGPDDTQLFSPPWEHDFDICFSTEVAVPLWNPMDNQPFESKYWHEDGSYATDNLEGDDSRVIMDRVIPFLEEAKEREQPFFTVIWFHAPHAPVVAGPAYRAMYGGYPENEQHYYGCITAMDEQVGRLNDWLKRSGLDEDTIIWFCSDNGPEGDGSNATRNCGSTGGLRGRKRSLFNGGVAVPTLLKWPKYVEPGSVLEMPCSTLDFLPTLIEEVGVAMPDDRPIDGESLLPYLKGETDRRVKPIPFRYVSSRQSMFQSPTFGLIDNDYKLLTNFSEDGQEDMVFNLLNDPFEENNIAFEQSEFVAAGKRHLQDLLADFKCSHYGRDYGDARFRPVNEFICNERNWTDE